MAQHGSKLTCDELEGLGDLRLVGVGFGNSTHFGGNKKTMTRRERKRTDDLIARSLGRP